MCSIEPYNPRMGSYHSYSLSSAITRSGCNMTDSISKLRGGKSRGNKSRKKTYRYTNGIKTNLYKKSHKTRRNKYNLLRFFFKNKSSKRGRITKKT